ncbi:4-hydroxy 2-oxovalerate aldolase [Maribacter dokdonensis]|uniref:4-hydroxy 2-oxovalerate aldolase n=1 Tax=Maribacter dokdonensis TaxID=320912 RepID=A0ABY0UX42_9FLAO|nr:MULTISPECIES: aldolase catalytic domain-containing protein [Maribacter]APA64324.1 HmgL [Maribacter sp. 1_2014MBL_MicDiv]SDT31970.1 4-hydroxy 2-oxovalerate aldolase [Maribacter dokdonensis]
MTNKPLLLDCTLRDGGYYTNWDFDENLVEDYCRTMENLPIEYVEVGYRSIPLKGYLGEYFYCPEYVLKRLKKLMPSKKLVIILNEKDIRATHVDELLGPCKDYIKLVRLAIDPSNFERAIVLAKAIKKMGFEVGFNVMYMSNWKENSSFLDLLEGLDDTIDYFYMVDSFGGVFPKDVKEIMDLVKSKTNCALGFHGHNNLEMAMANTLTAIDHGCSIVDATITGMGRGAGNLRTELFLTYLDSQQIAKIEYNNLSVVVAKFEKLKAEFLWGTSLPYMFSGANSLPQKQVMEWVGMNRYPISSIVNALNNQKEAVADNFRLPVLPKEEKYRKAIILGGGKTVRNSSVAIKKLLKQNYDICLVHAGARNVGEYLDVSCEQFYALVGFESEKLLDKVKDFGNISQTCVYPPYPRAMGTIVPQEIINLSNELSAVDFTNISSDSPLALAIQIALDKGVTELYFAGFDGYETSINHTQYLVSQENQKIFDELLNYKDVVVKCITPTKYKNMNIISVFSLVK